MPGAIAVELHPHSPRWAGMARSETARLHAALGPALVTVHHIGSTSIPGILAKPIIDLIPVVVDLASFDRRRVELAALGYECLGEFGLPGRRYCRRNDPATGKRAFQLHCYAEGSAEIERHVAFAAYLRAHSAIAQDYEAEKLRASALHPDDTIMYGTEKSGWIKRVEWEAVAWWKRPQS